MQTFRKPAKPIKFEGRWRKRSRLVDYAHVKNLKTGGLSEAIILVKTRSSGKLRIIKCISTKKGIPAAKELEILKRIPKGYHMNYMVEYAWTPDRLRLDICLEYCDMGSLGMLLEDHIRGRKTFHSNFIWHVLHDLGCALSFLHFGIKNPRDPKARIDSNWDTIAHLDIKPDNIFLSNAGPGRYPRIVLGDFGLAVTFSDLQAGRKSTRKQPGGTEFWLEPEARPEIVGERNLAYGRASDIWAIGGVGHALCLLRLAPDTKLLFQPRVDWPCGPGYGRVLNEVVSHCIRFDRHKRAHAPEIVRSTIRRR